MSDEELRHPFMTITPEDPFRDMESANVPQRVLDWLDAKAAKVGREGYTAAHAAVVALDQARAADEEPRSRLLVDTMTSLTRSELDFLAEFSDLPRRWYRTTEVVEALGFARETVITYCQSLAVAGRIERDVARAGGRNGGDAWLWRVR